MKPIFLRIVTLLIVFGLGLGGAVQAQSPGGEPDKPVAPIRAVISAPKDATPGARGICEVPMTPPAKTDLPGTESISGSSVTPWTGSCYWWDARQGNACFQVYNASPDFEWLDQVQLTFPTGWTVACNTQDATDSGGNTVNFTCAVAGTTVSYTDNDGGYGEIYDGKTWNFCVNISAPTTATGAQTLNWALSGDGWGSTPHDITGTTSLSQCGDTCALAPYFTNISCNGTSYYTLLGMDQSSGQNDSKPAFDSFGQLLPVSGNTKLIPHR